MKRVEPRQRDEDLIEIVQTNVRVPEPVPGEEAQALVAVKEGRLPSMVPRKRAEKFGEKRFCSLSPFLVAELIRETGDTVQDLRCSGGVTGRASLNLRLRRMKDFGGSRSKKRLLGQFWRHAATSSTLSHLAALGSDRSSLLDRIAGHWGLRSQTFRRLAAVSVLAGFFVLVERADPFAPDPSAPAGRCWSNVTK